MDVVFWASKVQPSKHLTTTMQSSRLGSTEHHLGFDDSEGDDDLRACFPCPFCYIDIEMPSLCTHLQEEHCFDFKNAVCPVCAGNLGKDIIAHFTLQHSSSLKRRRKSQRSGIWANTSTTLGKELRDLTSFLGVNSTKGAADPAPDSLLSPFLYNAPCQESENDPDRSSVVDTLRTSDAKSLEACPLEDQTEKMQRAEFFQQMVFSTIF